MAADLRQPRELSDLYEQDFYAWAGHQAETLRRLQATRPNLPLDFEHLIEEVDDLAAGKLRAVRSQLRRVIAHNLKLEFSPAAAPCLTWRLSIIDAQTEIEDDWTPAIRAACEAALPALYAKARRLAAGELIDHGEQDAAAALPEACPYTLDQLLDEDWSPGNRHGLVDEPL